MVKNKRKQEHVHLAVENFTRNEVLSDIKLLHNSLPELNMDEIDISTKLCGINLPAPIIFNALTGGFHEATKINQKLASIAKKLGIPMAVGSQKVALEDSEQVKSFKIARETYPDGIIIANVGAYASPEMAKNACEMLSADVLQVHLNVPQELAMAEGDRKFYGFLDNIAAIKAKVALPVIVKESGFGIKNQEISRLADTGIDGLDISGQSGTNFIKLENKRNQDGSRFWIEDWGLSTGQALLEASCHGFHQMNFIASGGFSYPIDIAKALALGVNNVGLAGYPLYLLWNYGEETLLLEIQHMLKQLKKIMLASGARDLNQLSQAPLVFEGKLLEYAKQRGINLTGFARRRINY